MLAGVGDVTGIVWVHCQTAVMEKAMAVSITASAIGASTMRRTRMPSRQPSSTAATCETTFLPDLRAADELSASDTSNLQTNGIQRGQNYSITSSARESSVGGT